MAAEQPVCTKLQTCPDVRFAVLTNAAGHAEKALQLDVMEGEKPVTKVVSLLEAISFALCLRCFLFFPFRVSHALLRR